MKEFLRLDNKLVIKLKIIPLSPLTIKYSSNDRNEEEKDDNITDSEKNKIYLILLKTYFRYILGVERFDKKLK